MHFDLIMSPGKNKILYYIHLKFGKNRIPEKVYLDTGSSVLWIDKKKCKNELN